MKISIITVTYNAASVLKRTLDSVKAQSWQQIEHLIIDGASKDETISMAETYKAQCPYEVVILSEPDKGLYDAMNKGLRLATGDYLVFLNAGDTLHAADTLETIFNFQFSIVKDLEFSTATRPLPMSKETSFTFADCVLPRNSRGSRSVRECSYVIRLSTP